MGSVSAKVRARPRTPQTADNSGGISRSLRLIKLCRSCTFQEACTRDKWGSVGRSCCSTMSRTISQAGDGDHVSEKRKRNERSDKKSRLKLGHCRSRATKTAAGPAGPNPHLPRHGLDFKDQQVYTSEEKKNPR